MHETLTYREFAQRYAGMTFDGSEGSPLWDRVVPQLEVDLAAEGRRLGFRLIQGAQRDLSNARAQQGECGDHQPLKAPAKGAPPQQHGGAANSQETGDA